LSIGRRSADNSRAGSCSLSRYLPHSVTLLRARRQRLRRLLRPIGKANNLNEIRPSSSQVSRRTDQGNSNVFRAERELRLAISRFRFFMEELRSRMLSLTPDAVDAGKLARPVRWRQHYPNNRTQRPDAMFENAMFELACRTVSIDPYVQPPGQFGIFGGIVVDQLGERLWAAAERL
jgi:hypothetical protein